MYALYVLYVLFTQVVKTQLQGSTVKKGSNAFSIAASIFKTEGPRGTAEGIRFRKEETAFVSAAELRLHTARVVSFTLTF